MLRANLNHSSLVRNGKTATASQIPEDNGDIDGVARSTKRLEWSHKSIENLTVALQHSPSSEKNDFVAYNTRIFQHLSFGATLAQLPIIDLK